jgi:hypothetical protein
VICRAKYNQNFSNHDSVGIAVPYYVYVDSVCQAVSLELLKFMA